MPVEVLESLAHNNYNLPRPRPIDPAVFYDILKIRRLVDDAASLAVRAASGVTSSSLTNSLSASNGILSNSGSVLGLGLGGGGGNAKLSRERKHRMREQTTQKLSKAYHLDEIACSVATMQSASSLEDVAQLVLQRSPGDPDAKYVHFFHEKIPSRQLAECTSLKPLDEIIVERPGEGEILRTRAITKIFKDDYVGAVQDLTAALQVCRYNQNQHKAGRQQLQLASVAATSAQRNGRWKEDVKIDEEDHPKSLEAQLLFHRAGAYLTIAYQHVDTALPPKANLRNIDVEDVMDKVEKEVQIKRLEAQKVVKTNAKRALRDFLSYLSHFDYTPGLPAEIAEEFVRKVNQAAHGFKIPRSYQYGRVPKLDNNGQLSDTLVPHNNAQSSRYVLANSIGRTTDIPGFPSSVVYQISTLFSAAPLSDLPSYPATPLSSTTKQKEAPSPASAAAQAILAQTDCHEAVTYHPLLTDALHSLLLCHCLLQTSARELLRHACMVARLTRVCDGYPIFQIARSPSRADWIEVLRRNDNWIQLEQSWETLCTPAPIPCQGTGAQTKETAQQKQERLKQQAIMEALEDERVHDEVSFNAAILARQRRQEEEALKAEGRELPNRRAQGDEDDSTSTERADAIVRWVRSAPVGGSAGGTRRKKRKSKSEGKGKVTEGEVTEESTTHLKMGELEVVEEID